METKLYRKRIIPNEFVYLKDDEIIYLSSSIIITKWQFLKPRLDFKYGFSCYYIEEGYKISKIFTEQREFLYTYCDIIDTEYIEEKNEYIFTDLLIDVIIYPDGFVKVVDLDEVSEAYDKGDISVSMVMDSLSKTDKLLRIIYKGKLLKLTNLMDEEIDKWLSGKH